MVFVAVHVVVPSAVMVIPTIVHYGIVQKSPIDAATEYNIELHPWPAAVLRVLYFVFTVHASWVRLMLR